MALLTYLLKTLDVIDIDTFQYYQDISKKQI